MVSDSDLCACSWSARSGASLESVPGGKIYDSLHGICLILDGLTNLISLICIQTRLRKLKKIQKANPDIDLKELLEQQARAEAEKNVVIVPGHTEDAGKEQE